MVALDELVTFSVHGTIVPAVATSDDICKASIDLIKLVIWGSLHRHAVE
jgi:hypothetical protein